MILRKIKKDFHKMEVTFEEDIKLQKLTSISDVIMNVSNTWQRIRQVRKET